VMGLNSSVTADRAGRSMQWVVRLTQSSVN
jgi:hypothetical protein